MGVEGHVWYSFLDRIFYKTTWRNVFKKLLIDQTIGAPIYALTYIIGKKIYCLNICIDDMLILFF